MTTIQSWDEVPAFESEAVESAFWGTHDLGDDLLAKMKPGADTELPAPRPRTRPIAIRFDESTLRRAKSLAARRGKGYQTLLKEFVSERLYEEEKREGLVGRDPGPLQVESHAISRSCSARCFTPNDFSSLDEVPERLLAFQARYEEAARPFE